MAEHISAKEYNLWELMSGGFIFNIPDYQRPYSWTENEALTLWDDLVEFSQTADGSENRSYFVGSIVLVKNSESPEAEVIDGQQRLSTLSIILSALLGYSSNLRNDIKKCLWEEGIQHKRIAGRPRVTLRKRDSEFFEKYIAKGNIQELLTIDNRHLGDDAQRLIQNNARAIQEAVAALANNGDSAIESFITMLFNQCVFVVVTTPDNESAFRVFSVMNDRGLSLLPSDIIKAHIIGEIREESRQYYTDKWEDIEVDLGRESFNALLSHIRMIYTRAKLHGTLVSEFEKNVFKGINNREEIISDIVEPYAKAYKAILRCEYASSKGADEVNELLSWLNRIDDADWIPAIMYVFVHCSSERSYLLSFIQKLERLAAYFYLTSRTSNQRIDRYSRVLDYLIRDNRKEAIQELELKQDEQKLFVDVLDGDVYLLPARKRTFLLLRLDRFVSDRAAKYQTSIFSIEHVLPQNPKADSQWILDWPESEAREYWLHKIANLIPLTRKKNSQAQNFDFNDKKEKYFVEKSGVTTYALTTEILVEKTWTPETVSNRQKKLIAVFCKNWNLLRDELSTVPAVNNQRDGTANENDAEIVHQRRLMDDLEKYFLANPQTELPRLPSGDLKVGEFVHQAMHQLCTSGFYISEQMVAALCTVEGSKKYTHRNLAFLVPVEGADKRSDMMKRYWTTPKYIEVICGKEYYVYSQWYPDHKISKDAHKSDFLQLYLDMATGTLGSN